VEMKASLSKIPREEPNPAIDSIARPSRRRANGLTRPYWVSAFSVKLTLTVQVPWLE
jgi:hypothetical protein